MARYLELLDWTGRQLRADKIGQLPKHLAPIFSRMGLDAPDWCDVLKKFGRILKQAAGTPESLAQEAIRRGQGWVFAPPECVNPCLRGNFRQIAFCVHQCTKLESDNSE